MANPVNSSAQTTAIAHPFKLLPSDGAAIVIKYVGPHVRALACVDKHLLSLCQTRLRDLSMLAAIDRIQVYTCHFDFFQSRDVYERSRDAYSHFDRLLKRFLQQLDLLSTEALPEVLTTFASKLHALQAPEPTDDWVMPHFVTLLDCTDSLLAPAWRAPVFLPLMRVARHAREKTLLASLEQSLKAIPGSDASLVRIRYRIGELFDAEPIDVNALDGLLTEIARSPLRQQVLLELCRQVNPVWDHPGLVRSILARAANPDERRSLVRALSSNPVRDWTGKDENVKIVCELLLRKSPGSNGEHDAAVLAAAATALATVAFPHQDICLALFDRYLALPEAVRAQPAGPLVKLVFERRDTLTPCVRASDKSALPELLRGFAASDIAPEPQLLGYAIVLAQALEPKARKNIRQALSVQFQRLSPRQQCKTVAALIEWLRYARPLQVRRFLHLFRGVCRGLDPCITPRQIDGLFRNAERLRQPESRQIALCMGLTMLAILDWSTQVEAFVTGPGANADVGDQLDFAHDLLAALQLQLAQARADHATGGQQWHCIKAAALHLLESFRQLPLRRFNSNDKRASDALFRQLAGLCMEIPARHAAGLPAALARAASHGDFRKHFSTLMHQIGSMAVGGELGFLAAAATAACEIDAVLFAQGVLNQVLKLAAGLAQFGGVGKEDILPALAREMGAGYSPRLAKLLCAKASRFSEADKASLVEALIDAAATDRSTPLTDPRLRASRHQAARNGLIKLIKRFKLDCQADLLEKLNQRLPDLSAKAVSPSSSQIVSQ